MRFHELKNLIIILAVVAGVLIRGPLPAWIKVSEAILNSPKAAVTSQLSKKNSRLLKLKKVSPGLHRPAPAKKNFSVAGVRG